MNDGVKPLRCDCVLHDDQQLREDVVALIDPEFKQEFSELEVHCHLHAKLCALTWPGRGGGHDNLY